MSCLLRSSPNARPSIRCLLKPDRLNSLWSRSLNMQISIDIAVRRTVFAVRYGTGDAFHANHFGLFIFRSGSRAIYPMWKYRKPNSICVSFFVKILDSVHLRWRRCVYCVLCNSSCRLCTFCYDDVCLDMSKMTGLRYTDQFSIILFGFSWN